MTHYQFWAFIVAAFVIGAFAGTITRKRVKPDTTTAVLTPAKYIPDDVIISNNWEAVYRKSFKAQWIVDCDFNTIKVTINRNFTKLHGYAMWNVYTQIYGSGRRPFGMYVSVNNHIEYMDWLREKYPMNYVHSPEYIERVMKSVYKAMKNPAQQVFK